MKQVLSLILIASLLASCGIKRPLELPGKGKHGSTDTQPATTDITLPDNSTSSNPAADNMPTQSQ